MECNFMRLQIKHGADNFSGFFPPNTQKKKRKFYNSSKNENFKKCNSSYFNSQPLIPI